MVTLPSGQQVEAERLAPPDLAAVQGRIKDLVRTLENFKQLRQKGRARAEYLEQVWGGVGTGAAGKWWGSVCVLGWV